MAVVEDPPKGSRWPVFPPFSRHWHFPIRACATPYRAQELGKAESPSASSRNLTRFSRLFGTIDPDTPQRQERQIVQSQLDLADSCLDSRPPWFAS